MIGKKIGGYLIFSFLVLVTVLSVWNVAENASAFLECYSKNLPCRCIVRYISTCTKIEKNPNSAYAYQIGNYKHTFPITAGFTLMLVILTATTFYKEYWKKLKK